MREHEQQVEKRDRIRNFFRKSTFWVINHYRKKTNLPLPLLIVFFCMSAMNSFCGEDSAELYKGEEATGEHVISLWQFLPGAETRDSSGNGHALHSSLLGKSRFSPAEKFGGCLEIFHDEKEKGQGAMVPNHRNLTPPKDFTIEMWINPKPELAKKPSAHLIDKMGVQYAHDNPAFECLRDYMMLLRNAGDGSHRVMVFLGFGRDAGRAEYRSDARVFNPGEWYHIAFTYDGKGTGCIYINGELAGQSTAPGKGAIVPGSRGIAIGDRLLSRYSSFPGLIAQVRILNRAIKFDSKIDN